jgi:SAM-dependent methyltransferase
MQVSEKHIKRIIEFIDKIETQTYPEAPSELHSGITHQMIDHFLDRFPLPPGADILDVGCGQGVALELFTEKGFRPQGITLNQEDVSACRAKGFTVQHMDQSFLEFQDDTFDLVWNRHCIEHSIFPLYTLHELKRVLKPHGFLYMEVPAPDTDNQHQANPNHYSVMGKSMWLQLLERSDYHLLETLDLNFSTRAGPDTYWVFIAQKK